jgi:hypothetical protein
LAPAVARAEVEDKIPGATSLAVANLVAAAVTVFVVFAMKGRPGPRLLLLVLLAALASVMLVELRFSDISEAVTTEMGKSYVVLAWMLVGVPLSGAIGLALRTRETDSQLK